MSAKGLKPKQVRQADFDYREQVISEQSSVIGDEISAAPSRQDGTITTRPDAGEAIDKAPPVVG